MTPNDAKAMATLRSNGRTFYFASHLLGSAYRLRAARLYAFCRYVDDLADEGDDPQRAALELEKLQDSLRHGHSGQSCVTDMIALMKELAIPQETVQSLIQGVQSDVFPRSIRDESELLCYSYQVAGTVGIMMSVLFDVRDPAAWPFAIDLGIAMQLTNIARDVGEDARKGRVYLPSTWVKGLAAERIAQPDMADARLVQLATQKVLYLAETYYRSGLDGIHYLPLAARYGIVAAAMVYREIGQVVAQADFCSWNRRAVVPPLRKFTCACSALSRYVLSNPSRRKRMVHDLRLHEVLQGCFGVHRPTMI
jgi:phytoene synthase